MGLKFITSLVLVFFISFVSLKLNAQSIALSPSNSTGFKSNLTGVRASLFTDNGIHPGFRIGTSYKLSEKEKGRKYLLKSTRNKKGSQLKVIQYLFDFNGGFYNHPNNHTGLILGLGATRIKSNTANLLTVGWSIEINYLRRIYNIPTYELDDDSELTEIGGAGNNSIVLSFAPSVGKLFRGKNNQRLWHLYFKPHFQYLKYDFGFFPNASAELGLSMSFKNSVKPETNNF